MGATDVHLAGREEYVDANIDQQAAFDFPCDLAGNGIAFVDGAQAEGKAGKAKAKAA